MFSIITGRRASKNLMVWGSLLATSAIGAAGCNTVPLLAPNSSTITLSTSSAVVQTNGTAEIRATVLESSGTPVQNGTTVTFSTNLGAVSPGDALTVNGVAATQFVANGQSGVAEVRAVSGAAKPADTANPTLKITVGGAAATRVLVTASPNRLGTNGGTSTITAVVSDANGNPLIGIAVSFSTDAGSLSSSVATTNASGQAVTTLTTTRDATVTATTGSTATTGTVKVSVGTLPDLSITAPAGSVLVQGQPVSFTVTVTPGTSTSTDTFQSVVVNFGDGTNSGPLGGGSTTVSHAYRSPGTYTVSATGTSVSGDSKSSSTIITITPRGVVNVTVASTPPSPVTKNQLVTFTATVTPTTTIVQSYNWDYGDGNGCSGCGSQVSHAYSTGGQTYTVNVTVRTTDGNSGNGQTQVVVSP